MRFIVSPLRDLILAPASLKRMKALRTGPEGWLYQTDCSPPSVHVSSLQVVRKAARSTNHLNKRWSYHVRLSVRPKPAAHLVHGKIKSQFNVSGDLPRVLSRLRKATPAISRNRFPTILS